MAAKVIHINNVRIELVDMPDAKDTFIQWLITREDGAPNFAMRRFVVKPGGYSPFHSHPYEHEVYVLSGTGMVHIDGQDYDLQPGTVVFVPPDAKHQFKNTGSDDLIFLCIIPHTK